VGISGLYPDIPNTKDGFAQSKELQEWKKKNPPLDPSTTTSSKRSRPDDEAPIITPKHPRLDDIVDPWNVLWDLGEWILGNANIEPYESPSEQWWTASSGGAVISTPGTSTS
jgi:hypothetical protein